MLIKKYILLLLAIVSFTNLYSQNTAINDSIQELIKKSNDKTLETYLRRNYLKLAVEKNSLIDYDSIRSKNLYKISNSFLKLKDSANFRKINELGLNFSSKIKDSVNLAKHYWDLATFYKYHKINDSAYICYETSRKINQKLGNLLNVGKLQYNISEVQIKVKDYTGSELTTTKAIEIFKELKSYRSLYSCYNNLGIIHNNLEEYEKALEYHNEALLYLKKSGEKNIKEATTLNNIGVVHRNEGNHELAVKNYTEALKYDSLFIKNTRLYATLTDNLAYSKFKLNDLTELPELFYKALRIRDSLDISAGIIINKLHLAEYYLFKKDTLKGLELTNEAMILAKKTNAFRDLLVSYKLLAEIEPENASSHLNEYIRVNDSLVKYERSIRNKFARIKFETEEVKTQNERLSIQNTWIVAVSTAIIFFGFLIYIITQQRTRNKELEMEQQQQRANEEIYNLMIDQQDKIEEGRKREKERISLELHDGILGRLFGTRLSLGSLNGKDDSNSKKIREQYINELQSIEEEVRNISHELGLDNFDKTTSYSTMIANLLEEQSKITNFKYQIEDDDRIVWTDIPGHIKINIYRIIQESVQNINKYAQAENVILDFKKHENRILLTIKDDGIGFDQEKRSNGIGLKNMKSRVTLLHGQFTINSVQGKGTSVTIDVPMA